VVQNLPETVTQARVRGLLTLRITEAGVNQLPYLPEQLGVLPLEFLQWLCPAGVDLHQLVKDPAGGFETKMAEKLVVKLHQMLGEIGGPTVKALVSDFRTRLNGKALEVGQQSAQLAVFGEDLIGLAHGLN